jgi:pyruvate,orthophosphate dikinase
LGFRRPPTRPNGRSRKTPGPGHQRAFDSYGSSATGWTGAEKSATRGGHIVVVQALANGELRHFLTRDHQTGALGPAAPNGGRWRSPDEAMNWRQRSTRQRAGARRLASVDGDAIKLVSARPPASAPPPNSRLRSTASTAGVDRERCRRRTDPARLQQMLHPRLKSP